MALNIPMVLPGAIAKTAPSPSALKGGGDFAALFMQKLQRPDLLDPLAAAGLASVFAQMPPPQVTANAPPGTSPPKGTAPPQNGSPPILAALGSSPPQTAAPPGPQQQQTAGQKNEFSGNILDAVTAKDIPAPQMTPTALTGLPASGADAFAQAPTAPQRQTSLRTQLPLLPQPQSQPQQTQPQQSQPPQPLQPQQLQPQLQQLLQAQPQADLSVQSPDPLARMIARAAAADTQRSASASAVRQMPASQTQQPAAQNSVSTTITNAAAAAFAKSLVTAAAQQQLQQQSQQSPHDQQQQPPPQNGQTQTAPLGAAAAQPQIAPAPAAAQPAAHSDAALTDPHAVVEQIVKSIVVHSGGTQSEVRLHLQPENLGDVSLKLTVNGNTIAANIVAQNADVRDVLLANTPQLVRSLADAGLSLGNFSVDVSGGNAGFTEQRSNTPQSSLKMRAIGSLDETEEPTWSDPRYGPPLASGASSLVLNYLA